MLLLAMLTGVWFNVAVLLFLIVCFILVLTVMIQKPQGGGLSAAFGASSGSGQTAFGTKTGDALTVATILVFVVWLVLAVALNIMSKPPEAGSTVVKPAPATTPGNAPSDTGTKPAVNPASPGENPPANNPAATPESPVEKPVQPVPAPVNPAPQDPAPVNPAPANPNPAPSPAPGDGAPR